MHATFPPVSDLVLIGGGHTHALVLRRLAMRPLPGLRLTLITPEPVAAYSGMLPGHVAGHYARADLMIDLMRLARAAGARIVLDRATGIARDNRLIQLASGAAPIGYDLASIDVGITSDLPDLPGMTRHVVAAKPIGPYLAAWAALLRRDDLARPRIAILGAGLGGTELALASAHRLRQLGRSPQVTLVGLADQVLPGLPPGPRRALRRALDKEGIALHLGQVIGAEAGAFLLADGGRIEADFLVSVAGARPQDWLGQTGLALTDGFVAVSGALQSSDPAIFAVGDCAHLSETPRPKAGVFAVREAPFLLHNLTVAATGQGRMRRYRPQRDYLKLVALGDRRALALRNGLAPGGAWAWAWKDRIDRRFMAMFHDLAMPMARPAAPARAAQGLEVLLSGKPLCGGCGAKVGAQGLTALAQALPAPRRADVLAGRGDDAAQLAGPGGQVQVISTDHLRALCLDEALMARIAATHALGDVWAMGAAPQAALAQIVLPQMAERLQGRSLARIMAAAAEVFAAVGADIIGGHTTLGAELTIGFTVTGLASRPLTKAGARPGDALILTKALGTGTILAAEMAGARLPGLVLGEVVAEALAAMARPLSQDAAILAPLAHAMTDVTGFGLAGHLLEMLEASGVSATLELAALPILPGAEALAAQGHGSHLAPANRAAALGRLRAAQGPRTDLLFDPQTGGGLLAALPAEAAAEALRALAAAGAEARRAGQVGEGPPAIVAR